MPDQKWASDLKTTMQVARARLDVRQKKKTEEVAKERYVVADLIRNNKAAKARIAVERIIREDYKVEAMERVDAYLEQLVMQLTKIKERTKNAPVDTQLEKPLANVLWASPFLHEEIEELKKFTAIFKKHFGLEYVQMCEMNKIELVDIDLIRCLSCDLIPKLLIEKYLIEICKTQNVPFEPDPKVMATDEFWTIGQQYVQQHPPAPQQDEKRPPPGGASGGGGGGGGMGAFNLPDVPMASGGVSHPSAPQFEKPPPIYSNPQPNYPNINFDSAPPPPPQASGGPGYPAASGMPRIGFTVDPKPPSPLSNDPFPRVPSASDHAATATPPGPSGGSEDPGFDDLARRFEELKKRK